MSDGFPLVTNLNSSLGWINCEIDILLRYKFNCVLLEESLMSEVWYCEFWVKYKYAAHQSLDQIMVQNNIIAWVVGT